MQRSELASPSQSLPYDTELNSEVEIACPCCRSDTFKIYDTSRELYQQFEYQIKCLICGALIMKKKTKSKWLVQ